jgi:hypothetical protein
VNTVTLNYAFYNGVLNAGKTALNQEANAAIKVN